MKRLKRTKMLILTLGLVLVAGVCGAYAMEKENNDNNFVNLFDVQKLKQKLQQENDTLKQEEYLLVKKKDNLEKQAELLEEKEILYKQKFNLLKKKENIWSEIEKLSEIKDKKIRRDTRKIYLKKIKEIEEELEPINQRLSVILNDEKINYGEN